MAGNEGGDDEVSAQEPRDREVGDIVGDVMHALDAFRIDLFNALSHHGIHDFTAFEYSPPFLGDEDSEMTLAMIIESYASMTRQEAVINTDVNISKLLNGTSYFFTSSCPICLCDDGSDTAITYETLSRLLGRKTVAIIASMVHDTCVKLKCGHCFHMECIRPWVAKRGTDMSCPMCRDRSIRDI